MRCLSASFVFSRGRAQDFDGKWSAPELPMSPAMAFSAFAGGKAPDAEVKAWTDEGWTDAEGPSVRGPEVAEGIDIPGESGIIDTGRVPDFDWKAELHDNLDLVVEKPELLQSATPEEWYSFLRETDYTVKPLGDGQLKGMPFEAGGGFRINWGGDRILQYHPAGRNHHGGGAYWKIFSGALGIRWFDIYGNPLP